MAVTAVRPIGVSSDYAAKAEMLADFAAMARHFLAEEVGGRWVVRLEEPPLAPALGVLCQLDRPDLPVEVRADVERFMVASQKTLAKFYPSMPVEFAVLLPPLHARHGFVVYAADCTEPPVYPRIVSAGRIHVRLSDEMRRLLRSAP